MEYCHIRYPLDMFLHDMTQSFSAIWFLRANINKFKNFHVIGWRLINIPLKCTTDRSNVGPPLKISITKFVFAHVQVRHWILQSDWMTTYFSVYTRATDISNFFFHSLNRGPVWPCSGKNLLKYIMLRIELQRALYTVI